MPLSKAWRELLNQLPGEAAWAVQHLGTGTIWSYNDRRFLAASTIKLPVLALYAEQRLLPAFAAEFAADYVYAAGDYCVDSPCFDAIAPGTAVSWDRLAEWMMVRSDNTATNLLIDRLGLRALQEWIGAQGWQETRLNRRMMDTEARARGVDNWTSPLEMMELMARLVRGSLIAPAAAAWMLEILHRCEDREKIPFLLPPDVLVANKPGELPGTRSDVGYLHSPGHQVVMAVFCDGLPDAAAELQADLWLAELAKRLWQELTA